MGKQTMIGRRREIRNRVGNFRQKNNSAEDGIDGTIPTKFRLFRGTENNLEFRSVEQKQKHTLRIPFRILQRKRKQLGIPFRGKNIEANCRNSVSFCSIPSFGMGSSEELGLPRNEHFLPRNNGNDTSLFRGMFSERNSVPNPNQERRGGGEEE